METLGPKAKIQKIIYEHTEVMLSWVSSHLGDETACVSFPRPSSNRRLDRKLGSLLRNALDDTKREETKVVGITVTGNCTLV